MVKFVSASQIAVKKSHARTEPDTPLALELLAEIMAPQIAFESNMRASRSVEEAERRVKSMPRNELKMTFVNSYMLASNNLLENTTQHMGTLIRRFDGRVSTLFKRFDINEDGKLGRKEFCTYLETLGVWGAVPGVTPRRPARRALLVGECVGVLLDEAEYMSNTKQTPGWSDWSKDTDLNFMGKVGCVHEIIGDPYPDLGAAYTVIFPGNKLGSFAHDNLIVMMPVKVSTRPDMLLPFDDRTSSWDCDDKSANCNRKTKVNSSGEYLGVRWSNNHGGGKYNLCEKCLSFHRVLPSAVLQKSPLWKKVLTALGSNTSRGLDQETFRALYTQAPTRALMLEQDLEYSALPKQRVASSSSVKKDTQLPPPTMYLSPTQPHRSPLLESFTTISSHPMGAWIVAAGRNSFAAVFNLDFGRHSNLKQFDAPGEASQEYLSRVADYIGKVPRPSGCPIGSVKYMNLWQHSVSDQFGQMFMGKQWDEWFEEKMRKYLEQGEHRSASMALQRQALSLERCHRLQSKKACVSSYVSHCEANPKHPSVAMYDETSLLVLWKEKKEGWVEVFAQNRGFKHRLMHFKWNPNGENLCVAYKDGHIQCINRAGTQVWMHKLFPQSARCVPCMVEWSSDSQSILVATQPSSHKQQARVVMFNAETCDELSQMTVSVTPRPFSKRQKIVAMEWSRGDSSASCDETLIVAFKHGKLQLARWEDEAKVIDTGLDVLHACKWNSKATFFAISGLQAIEQAIEIQSDSDIASPVVKGAAPKSLVPAYKPIVQLRSRTGELLAQIAMENSTSRPITSLCWLPLLVAPNCNNGHIMQLCPPARTEYKRYTCDKCRRNPPSIPRQRYHCALCKWDICPVCFKAPEDDEYGGASKILVSLDKVVHVISVRPGSRTRQEAADTAATESDDSKFLVAVDWKDATPIEVAVTTGEHASKGNDRVLLRGRFDNEHTKFKRVSFVVTQVCVPHNPLGLTF